VPWCRSPIAVGRGVAAAVAALAVSAAFLQPARAGSARDYLNAPVDSWLTFSSSSYATSVTPEDGLDISARVRTNVFSQTFIATRTIDVFGRTGGFSVLVPYVAANASDGSSHVSNDGMSDIGIMGQVNIFGGPALSREQFRSFVPQTFSSFHMIMLIPTGKYDPADAINPSANRFTFYPTINYSYTPDEGWTWLEVYASAKLFTPNPDFGPGGTATLSQNALYLTEFHASRNLTPELWLSADAYYNVGGETRIDGVAQGNAANTLRLGVGMGLAVWQGGQLVANYEEVVAKPAQEPDSRTFRLKVQQLW